MATEKWIPIPPGGPSGPFWGVMIAPQGWIVASQLAAEKYARLLIQAGQVASYDFDTISEAAIKLRGIMSRDFPDHAPPVDEGAESYVIRSVIEALFGGILGEPVSQDTAPERPSAQ